MKPDTTIKNWEIITVDGGEKDRAAIFIYGIIIIDLKDRFDSGDFVFTSPVIEIFENILMARTKNTIYKLEGPGSRHNVSAGEAFLMRTSGISYKSLLEWKTSD